MKNIRNFTDEDGKELVKTARKAVAEYLKNKSKIADSDFHSRFNFESGVFVTINKKDSLRGCIGYPIPIKKLSYGLIDAAISAATQDPRFTPVSTDELDKIVFEVTVLTPPVEIKVDDPLEYLSIIKVGRDGLIVENSYSSGLLLPQVPTEYGWDVEEFLQHTCEKAGINKDSWKEGSTKISIFEGVIFKEESPNGKIVRESTNNFL
ncbi:AMMECR1 domain-containing protein [Nitrosopumilus zosterae]|uniref:Protein NZNM25_18900 n=1 Tax=Nitrosopumilus zosterae TaxID=718286 RepID=A0A2S2KTZ2_9ARCH|nr:TIGR00296 family protein [Nitrosopumilus zosterae]BDQ31750.1 TIGR00296 family protein [Nitrosopumilus zosterae]GBH35099.1 AMMECR1 domain-containing protein [Nitrosopumilus zosterae]